MSETHASSIVALSEVVKDFCSPEDLQAFSNAQPTDVDPYQARTEVATRIHGELEAHDGEHREALDALDQVIHAKVINRKTGERDIRGQVSAIREAIALLVKNGALV